TRLLLEVAAGAAARGREVIAGECQAGGAGPAGAPLQPFRRLLIEMADRVRQVALVATAFAAGARVLALFEPALQAALGPGAAEEDALPPGKEQARVAAAL